MCLPAAWRMWSDRAVRWTREVGGPHAVAKWALLGVALIQGLLSLFSNVMFGAALGFFLVARWTAGQGGSGAISTRGMEIIKAMWAVQLWPTNLFRQAVPAFDTWSPDWQGVVKYALYYIGWLVPGALIGAVIGRRITRRIAAAEKHQAAANLGGLP